MSLTKCAQHNFFRSFLSLAEETLEQECRKKIFSRFLVFDKGTHKGRSDKVIKKVQGQFWIRKKVRTKGETFFYGVTWCWGFTWNRILIWSDDNLIASEVQVVTSGDPEHIMLLVASVLLCEKGKQQQWGSCPFPPLPLCPPPPPPPQAPPPPPAGEQLSRMHLLFGDRRFLNFSDDCDTTFANSKLWNWVDWKRYFLVSFLIEGYNMQGQHTTGEPFLTKLGRDVKCEWGFWNFPCPS